MRTKPKEKQRKIIELDFTEWELGDWPNELWKAVEVEKSDYSVSIEINYTIMETMAKKVATEAVEAYLDGVDFWLSDKGLEIVEKYTDDDEPDVVIAWDDLWFRSSTDLDAVQKALDARRAELKDEEDEEA